MTYEFTIRILGHETLTDQMAGRLYEAGCDDGLCWSGDYKVYVTFDREASSRKCAVASALAQIRGAGFTARIEPDSF